MATALAKKMLSPETREMRTLLGTGRIAALPQLEPGVNITRLINKRFKRPYAKKGWWWSGLWDPSAKNRSMVEKVEYLFEQLRKKTYEETHTAARNEEAEAEFRFIIHSQNMEIEAFAHFAASAQESSHPVDTKHNAMEEHISGHGKIIDLAAYKAGKVKAKSQEYVQTADAVALPVPAMTKITAIRLKADGKAMETKTDVKMASATRPTPQTSTDTRTISCDAKSAIREIIKLVDVVAQDMATEAPRERQNQIMISMGTSSWTPASAMIEIFVEEIPAQSTVIAFPTSATQQPQQTIANPVPQEITMTSVSQTQTSASSTVITSTPNQQQNEGVIASTNQMTGTAPQPIVDAPPQILDDVPFTPQQAAPEIAAPQVLQSVVVFPTANFTAPLAETIMMADTQPQQKTDPVPPQKDATTAPSAKNGRITVFFARQATGAKLLQTDAQAAPEE